MDAMDDSVGRSAGKWSAGDAMNIPTPAQEQYASPLTSPLANSLTSPLLAFSVSANTRSGRGRGVGSSRPSRRNSEAIRGELTEHGDAGDCSECPATHRRVLHRGVPARCRCGAEYVPPQTAAETRLRLLVRDADTLAEWAPHYQGRAMDLQRSRRPVAADTRTPEERERREAAAERERSKARGLFVRLETLRCEAARSNGPELTRAVACIDWLIERHGAERTAARHVNARTELPSLSRLVGEAFADAVVRLRARAVPPVARRAPSDPPPKSPPSLEFTEDPVFTTETPEQRERALAETLSIRAQEWSTRHQAQGAFVVEGLVWLLRRLLHVHHERERQRTAAEIRADAEQAKVAIERHGAELLRDAAWLWSATDVATEDPQRGFEEICGAAVARIVAEQERRKRAEEQR